ncbi:MAG: Mu transposase domain-containing protein [Steroidobacteraceae bacterium]
MLTWEDDVEIHALARRGWSVSAIARHTGRDRKTIRKCLAEPGVVRESAPSCVEPYRAYLEARFVDDAHVFASVLFEELGGLGFDRSYPTLVREIRGLGLRPVCDCCKAGGVKLTVGLEHEPGEELQLDWLELSETPWGVKAYVLVGALSHSGRLRGCFSEGESFPHLAEALDGVLRRIGGSTRSWRTDRMATFVYPGTDRLRPEAAAMAKHYGVQVAVCPANRPQRKGVVEKAIQYVTQSWWRSAPVSTPAQAQADLDRWCVTVSDRRRRGRGTVGELAAGEGLLVLPELPFPAEYREERVVSREALVEFESNRYSVPPGHAGQSVEVRARLGELYLEIYTSAAHRIARHRRALSGAGQTIRTPEHASMLEQAVLKQFTTSKACPRKPNRPPGEQAQAEAARLRGEQAGGVVVDLEQYARIARVAGR